MITKDRAHHDVPAIKIVTLSREGAEYSRGARTKLLHYETLCIFHGKPLP